MMGYPQPGMIPPRPRYAPTGQPLAGMPVPAPYGQPPQGYGIPPGYPRPPRPTGPPRGDSLPSNGGPAAGPAQPAARPAAVNGVPGVARAGGGAVPPGGIPSGRAPPAGAPAAGRPGAGYKGPAGAVRPAGQAGGSIPGAPEGITLTPAALANASPMEQKQMLGEVLFLKIAPTQPELAGKITGMLLEIDNSELLLLIENEEALNNKVTEAIVVLNEYSGPSADAPAA